MPQKPGRAAAQSKYNKTTAQRKRNASRKSAQAIMQKAGKWVKGKDVEHIDGNPMNNKLSNLKMERISKNRSVKRTKTAGKDKSQRK